MKIRRVPVFELTLLDVREKGAQVPFPKGNHTVRRIRVPKAYHRKSSTSSTWLVINVDGKVIGRPATWWERTLTAGQIETLPELA